MIFFFSSILQKSILKKHTVTFIKDCQCWLVMTRFNKVLSIEKNYDKKISQAQKTQEKRVLLEENAQRDLEEQERKAALVAGNNLIATTKKMCAQEGETLLKKARDDAQYILETNKREEIVTSIVDGVKNF